METAASLCDAFEAMRLLEARYFDAAFLDIRMPGLSGLDIIRRRVGQPFCPRVRRDQRLLGFYLHEAGHPARRVRLLLKAPAKGGIGRTARPARTAPLSKPAENGPLLLARLCVTPKRRTKRSPSAAFPRRKTRSPSSPPRCPPAKSLLSLAGGKLFSILRTSSGRCFSPRPRPPRRRRKLAACFPFPAAGSRPGISTTPPAASPACSSSSRPTCCSRAPSGP